MGGVNTYAMHCAKWYVESNIINRYITFTFAKFPRLIADPRTFKEVLHASCYWWVKPLVNLCHRFSIFIARPSEVGCKYSHFSARFLHHVYKANRRYFCLCTNVQGNTREIYCSVVNAWRGAYGLRSIHRFFFSFVSVCLYTLFIRVAVFLHGYVIWPKNFSLWLQCMCVFNMLIFT